MPLSQLILLMTTGAAALFIIFTLTWIIQLKTKNAAIVDTVWSISFPLLALIYFLFGDGFFLREIIMLSMVMVWGLRLATYLFLRTMGHSEDIRYTVLREQWGSKQNILMLRFFYFQAILALALSLPFALVMINQSPTMHWIEWVGASVWFVAVIGETLADSQLKKFKSNPLNKGKICEAGLWNYSRHPNYFFEWLIWVSYFIFALGSPNGWLSIICPTAILYFLLKVTGIPYTETQMIKSRGQAFIDYQRTTSAFIPLPKRLLANSLKPK
jgi:steroid 5-alpha reductase family enzyme